MTTGKTIALTRWTFIGKMFNTSPNVIWAARIHQLLLLHADGGLRVPWAERRSNQSTLEKISPEYSLEGLMLKVRLQ